MLKKGICVLLSLLVLVGVVPVAQVAAADASLNLYDITSTNYGVIDKDVVATRFAEGEGYEIVYPPDPASYKHLHRMLPE